MSETEKVDLKKIIEEMEDVVNIWALLYVYMTRPVIAGNFGKKAEVAIREGVRNFGAFRGQQMKKWHESEGLPINVETLNRFWDAASFWLVKDAIMSDAKFTPYHVTYPVYECNVHDVWKEEDWEEHGYWYCDENHESIMKNYHKDGVVEIHKNLCKCDDCCTFEWMQIPAGPVDNSATDALRQKMADDPEPHAMECLKRTVRIVGAMYIFLAESIVKHLGDEGRELVKNAVTALGERRGKDIKEKLIVAGKKATVENIFAVFDLPYKLMWKLTDIESKGSFKAKVNYCPLGELWNELGLSELGALYCRGMYEAMFKEFDQHADIRVPACVMRGDKHCTFDFKIRNPSQTF